MYGKIHQSFFDSSINESNLITRFVFMAMIVLSDRDGNLDATTKAFARRLNLSDHLQEVERAIATLSAPDPQSRSSAEGGRRIIPIDPRRGWGWIVVNKAQYRDGSELSEEDAREQARARKQRQRERERSQDPSSLTSSPNTDPYANTHTDTASVTVTQSHDESRSRHDVSRAERDAAFARLWELVPRKEGKQDARKHFEALLNGNSKVDPEKVYAGNLPQLESDLERAIGNYTQQIAANQTEPRFTKNGGTLFYNFGDYVNFTPVARFDTLGMTRDQWDVHFGGLDPKRPYGMPADEYGRVKRESEREGRA